MPDASARWWLPLGLAWSLVGCGGGGDAPQALRELPQADSAAASTPVFRFAKISNGAYFYTGSEEEKNLILRSNFDMRYEGYAFLRTGDGSGQPVHRFANLVNGGYFYTASEAERQLVLATRPDMRYEGSSFSVARADAGGAAPVYRLANLRNGAYLFTGSAQEAAAAVALGFWRNEGTAFHALPAPVDPTAPIEPPAPPAQPTTAAGCFNPKLYTPGTVYGLTYSDTGSREAYQVSGPGLVDGTSVAWVGPATSGPAVRSGYVVKGTDVYLKGLQVPIEGYSVLVSFSPEAPVNQFSAKPGTVTPRQGSISGTVGGAVVASGGYSTSTTFLGFEDVSVPAGTFRNACKFSVSIDIPGYRSETGTQWVAQGSGVLVKVVSNLVGTRSLVAADIQGVAVKP